MVVISRNIWSFAAGPFAFQDSLMEKRFRENFIGTIFDRTGRIMCVWLPFVGMMRLVWLTYWVMFPFELSVVDLVIFAVRILFLILGTIMFARNWAEVNKKRIGLANFWIARAYLVVAALGESDVDKRDPQKLASLVAYLCICGLFIPSFTEYLLGALPLSLTRPVILSLFPRAGLDQPQEIIFQHGLILALGLSITWTAHADCRRDWLRSADGSRNTQSDKSANDDKSRAACHNQRAMLNYTYLSDPDLQECHAEALQVLGPQIAIHRCSPGPRVADIP